MGASWTYARRVAFSDTDMAGIVHYSNYLRYIEDGEAELLGGLGIPVTEERAGGVLRGWPRVDVQCRFRMPLRYPEAFELVLVVSAVESQRVRLQGEFQRAGTTVAEAEWVIAYAEIDRAKETVRTLPLPDAWRTALLR